MSLSLPWIMLLIAGLLEIGWAVGLKYTEGFTKLVPSIFTITLMAASMYLLAKAGQHLPIGTAYAVWVGIGSFGAAVLGMYLFNEPANPLRIAFLVLLIIAIVGLKLTAK